MSYYKIANVFATRSRELLRFNQIIDSDQARSFTDVKNAIFLRMVNAWSLFPVELRANHHPYIHI